MKRGEIRWYKFLPPDKKRPILILMRDSVLEYLGGYDHSYHNYRPKYSF